MVPAPPPPLTSHSTCQEHAQTQCTGLGYTPLANEPAAVWLVCRAGYPPVDVHTPWRPAALNAEVHVLHHVHDDMRLRSNKLLQALQRLRRQCAVHE